jgi:putative ABC transport system permease protein
MLVANYLKVAWRNFMKSKVFSFINVLGLSVGLTCCMLISLYLLHETSYDSFHKNIDRLYQVGTVFISNGDHRGVGTPAPMATVLKQVFPQIETTARLLPLFEDKTLFKIGDKSLYEDKGSLADSGFFRIFTYQFVQGDASTAMDNPYGIVINEEIAHQLFNNESALGKVIHISSNTAGDHDYEVTGVFRPTNVPSHIDSKFFLSMHGGIYGNWLKTTTNMANNNMFRTYILLNPRAKAADIEHQFPAFVDRYEGKELKEDGFYKSQFLLPVRDIHLYAHTEDGMDVTPEGSTASLFILGSIALFTLLIACINFMNLATARSSKRSSEVGVRKALGAGRNSLIWQFLGEALLMSLIAFVIAIFLTYAALPGFEHLANRNIQLTEGQTLRLGIAFLTLAILTGLIAGSYPALYLSSFKPLRIMRGRASGAFKAAALRKGLVVFQFAISVILIVASVVIARQMRYVREKDLGFNKERQLIVPLRSITARHLFPAMKTQLAKDPRILSTGGSAFYPGIDNGSDQTLYAEGKTVKESYDTKLNYTDFDFLKSLGVQLVAGHLFTPDIPSDSVSGIVLNEKAVKAIGYTPHTAVGHKVYNYFQGQTSYFSIVGVVKDFNFSSLHEAIDGYGVLVNTRWDHFSYLVIHLAPGDPATAITDIKNIWKQLDPAEPFDYTFLDTEFQKAYDADTRLADIVSFFTAIAIAISCLGLFGLAAFSAEQRNKEIGIRKVLGASATSIVQLLTADFVRLVIIAILVACPIAWFIMQRWLQNFVYHTRIDWTVFALTAAAAVVIALATISTQAIRAALANPVKSLRSE